MARPKKEEIVEVDVQPSGVDLSKTLWAVNEMLINADFCEDVKAHNGWPEDMSSDRAALLFLTARYQSTVDVLVRRTDYLLSQMGGNEGRVVALEDAVFITKV